MRCAVAMVGGILCMSTSGFAQQWSNVGTSDIRNANAGLVGIGTNPSAGALHVYSGSTIGIYAQTNSTGTAAMYASIANSSNAASAVFGTTASTNGGGVFGYSSATSGAGYGVWGDTLASAGYGVVGRGLATSGTGVGVYGSTASSSGFAFYGVGGKNYFDGDTGIGTSAPGAKLDVQGSVRLQTIGVLSAAAGTTYSLSIKSNGDVVKQPPTMGSGIREYRGAGTYSFTIPSGVTRIHVKLWGGGGGGSTAVSGGSGAYIEGIIDLGGYSGSLSVIVGGGGAVNGNGGDTSISQSGTYFVYAGGGASNGAGGLASYIGSATSIIAKDGFTVPSGGQILASPGYPGPQEQATSGGSIYLAGAGSGGLGGSATTTPGFAGAVTIQW